MAESRLEEEDLRLLNAARRRFGGYSKALRAAGILPELVRLRAAKATPADIARLGREMRRVAALCGRDRAEAARVLKAYYKTLVFEHLGNWRKACRRFGVKVEDLEWSAYASKKQVIEGLCRWAAIPGARAERIYQEDRALRSAACRRFGSWKTALKAAGVSFSDRRKTGGR